MNSKQTHWIIVSIAAAIAFIYGFGIGIDLYESTSDSAASEETSFR